MTDSHIHLAILLLAVIAVGSTTAALALIRCKEELESIASSLRNVVIYEQERTRLLGGRD